MNKNTLAPADLASVLQGGFKYLELNRTVLDRLNVFPVPDGDTGANMASTLAAGIEALEEQEVSIQNLGRRFNTEINRCSRGNSGFILARFFHGFFEALHDSGELSVKLYSEAISNGSFHVNGALFSPTEGTMISILSAVSLALTNSDIKSISDALTITVNSATEALFLTPKQLPVLDRAGVVDSGALGLVFIFRGMLTALNNTDPVKEIEADYRFEPNPDAPADMDGTPEYRFCTEAVVLRNEKQDEELNDWLRCMGNSIALVNKDDLLKIHIHTNEPKAIFKRLETLGRLEHTKVDDMQEQSRLVSAETDNNGGLSLFAFVPGEGFERIYEDLGVSNCFIYGETLPSPDEISEVLKTIESQQIIILPNNSNILPSVMAVRDICEKNLSIVPTKTVIQGITASYGFSADDTVVDNVDSMNGFINDAIGLFVYISTLDTRFGETDLKTGDWFVTRSKEVLGVGKTAADAIRSSLQVLETSTLTDAAIYHGDGFDPRDLDKVINEIKSVIPDVDIEDHFGGQSRAALIISLE